MVTFELPFYQPRATTLKIEPVKIGYGNESNINRTNRGRNGLKIEPVKIGYGNQQYLPCPAGYRSVENRTRENRVW